PTFQGPGRRQPTLGEHVVAASAAERPNLRERQQRLLASVPESNHGLHRNAQVIGEKERVRIHLASSFLARGRGLGRGRLGGGRLVGAGSVVAGFVVAGLVVAGSVVAGLVVAGSVVAGLVVAGLVVGSTSVVGGFVVGGFVVGVVVSVVGGGAPVVVFLSSFFL